jgi:hypothetical protein
MLFKSIGSFLAILTCGLSLHATDLPKVENDSPMPVQQTASEVENDYPMPVHETASAPWEYLSNEIWVNIFKFLPLQEWPCLLQVNKIFGELIKKNAPYLASHNPEVVQIFQALGGTETGLRNAKEYFCKNPEDYKQFWTLFLPLMQTLNEIEKGTFRYQGAFGENFEKAKQEILKHDPLEEKLSFFEMNLSFLPREIASLTTLKTLSLRNNQIISLPSKITKLTKLKYLNLGNNQIADVSAIGNLVALENLYLSNNQIAKIPSKLFHLKALQNLALSHNQLLEIPSEIGNLVALEYLYLSNNQITDVSAIGNLVALGRLNLAHNQITDLLLEIAQLTKLEKLNMDMKLSGNPLSDKEKENIQAWFKGTKVKILL